MASHKAPCAVRLELPPYSTALHLIHQSILKMDSDAKDRVQGLQVHHGGRREMQHAEGHRNGQLLHRRPSSLRVRSRTPGLIAPGLAKRGTVSNLVYLAGDCSQLVKKMLVEDERPCRKRARWGRGRCWTHQQTTIEDESGKKAAVADRAVCDMDRREAMDSSRCLLVLGQTTLD